MARAMFELLILVAAGTSIWVLVDAPTRGLSMWWAAGTLLLWIVVFPIYLVERNRAVPVPPHPVPPAGRWEPDPRDPEHRERWVEGSAWTRHIRPRQRP